MKNINKKLKSLIQNGKFQLHTENAVLMRCVETHAGLI